MASRSWTSVTLWFNNITPLFNWFWPYNSVFKTLMQGSGHLESTLNPVWSQNIILKNSDLFQFRNEKGSPSKNYSNTLSVMWEYDTYNIKTSTIMNGKRIFFFFNLYFPHQFSRYTKYGEENLPKWFMEDEIQHRRKQMPVTKVISQPCLSSPPQLIELFQRKMFMTGYFIASNLDVDCEVLFDNF